MGLTGKAVANDAVEDLPLHLFLWIAGRAGAVSPRELQVFLRMLDNGTWCRSRWARENLPRAHQRHAASWNGEALARMKRDLEGLYASLRSLRDAVAPAEAELARTDLLRLAEATARASGGLLGAAGLRREQRDALRVFSALAEATLLASDGPAGGEAAGSVLASREANAPTKNGETTAGENRTGQAGAPQAGDAKGREPKSRRRIRCVQIVDETADVRTLRFSLVGGAAFNYLPGQFVTVEIPAGDEVLKRSYTIASSPSRPGVLELTVKRLAGGRVSNWLHDQLKVGDELMISGPAGHFSCERGPTSEKLLFISAGSGITPVMSMSRFLHDTADPRDVVFLHSARAWNDLVFRNELALMAARSAHFRTVFTLTGADAPAGEWPRALKGRLSSALIEDAVPDFRQRTVFLCGPNPFMEAVRLALAESDFPMTSFHAESFGGPRAARSPHEVSITTPADPGRGAVIEAGADPGSRPRRASQLLGILPRPRLVLLDPLDTPPPCAAPSAPNAAGAGGATAIVFSTSGREARGSSRETILEAAEGLGLPIPSACRSGVCGTCKTRKLSGTVSMDCEDGLDPGDRSAGFILACTAHPLDRVTVEA